jgi:carboxylate-amine ligase
MPTHPTAFTIGVEEEYQIIDPITRALSSSAEYLVPQLQSSLGERVQFEIHLAQIEVATAVCQSLADLRQELSLLRNSVITTAEQAGLQISSAGTHPFSTWHEQQFTPQPRYASLETNYQQLAREQSIFGCHVHIGIQDRSLALQTLNYIRGWISTLIALSANSPFWQGADTGYASYRTELWSRWPLAGLPFTFTSLAEFEDLAQSIVATGMMEDPSKIYWDIRPSLYYPTLEVRAMDVALTIDEAVMLAGLVRALVRTGYEQALAGEPLPVVRPELLRIAHWFAARYGLSDKLIDIEAKRAIPAAELVEKFLHYLRPALEANDDWSEISSLVDLQLRNGNGAQRQRAIYHQTASLEDVVDSAVAATKQGTLFAIHHP